MDIMTKANGRRPRLGLIPGRGGQEGTLDVSVIGAGMRVVGRVHSSSVVKVAGTVLGNVSADGQVLVAKGGWVEGDVYVREVVLDGEVRGSVTVEERVEIQESAVIHGDITKPWREVPVPTITSVPKVVPSRGEAPPFVLPPGEYRVTVATPNGRSDPLTFRLINP